MAEPREVKIDIDNGISFFADEAGVIHNPVKVILDFRSVTPRIDVRAKDYQPVVLRHTVVVMDPYVAKNFSEILQQNLAEYERRYGKIDKPAALKKSEKEKPRNEESKKAARKGGKKDSPSYFG